MNVERLEKAIKNAKWAADEIVEDVVMQISEGSTKSYIYVGTIAALKDAVDELEIAFGEIKE